MENDGLYESAGGFVSLVYPLSSSSILIIIKLRISSSIFYVKSKK